MSATTQAVAQPDAEPAPDYDDDVVRLFIIAAVFWALVGMSMGVFIAAQMVWPELNIEPWFNFGRLRPVYVLSGGDSRLTE